MRQSEKKSVILVLGGVRSGKSRYAQQLAERSTHVTFIATAERRNDDAEMHAKIARHRADRPAHWPTIEEPLRIAGAIQDAVALGDTVLVDCLTIYAANVLEASNEDQQRSQTQQSSIDELCETLRDCTGTVILVSNEVGSGVVPAYVSGRRFRDLVGEINQQVASIADTVLLLVAGLPLVLKGSLPSEVS